MVRFDNYPYDNFLFVDKSICPTLGIRKLARSKYDRFTNRHVARFDHYCGWIHNTVGEENYRYFLLFLLVHVGMCVYGTVITWTLFVGEIRDKDLYNAIFFNGNTGDEVKADTWIIVHYMVMRHFELSSVLILMTAMSVVLFLFLGFHLFMAANGMTTNEFYKWRQVKKWYKREKSRYEKALKEGIVVLKQTQSSSSTTRAMDQLNDVDVGCVGPINNKTVENNYQNTTSETSESTSRNDNNTSNITQNHNSNVTDPGPPPINIYNRGIVENFKEVIFPRSLRRDALMRYAESRRHGQNTSNDKSIGAVEKNSTKTKST